MTDIPENYIPVLDKGYVGLVDFMGNDWTPTDAARVSFAKRSDNFTDRQNIRLLEYLFRNREYSCLRHNVFRFEIRMPLMVARQLWKYVVASNFTEDQLGWNENSRRYITDGNEFYLPGTSEWRSAPDNKKQGSGENLKPEIGGFWTNELEQFYLRGEYLYNKAIEEGIAPEQARLFLPSYGLYVTTTWTTSLAALLHVLEERLGHTAQHEITQYALALQEIVKREIPVIMNTWEKTV